MFFLKNFSIPYKFEMKKNFKNKILERIGKTYCRIKVSKVNGVGVFAMRNIPMATDPFTGIRKQKWSEMEMSNFKHLDKGILKMIDDFFVIEKNGKVLVPEFGLNGMDISFFLNNSKKPNMERLANGNFITIRKIKKGEELMVSYKTYDWKY